eukprot:195215_1
MSLSYTFSLIYIVTSWANSQYSTIWENDMSSLNEWTVRAFYQDTYNQVFVDVPEGNNIGACSTGECIRTQAKGTASASIRTSVDITGYTSIRLLFDGANRGLDSGDLCKVYYSYRSTSISGNQLIKTYAVGPNGEQVLETYFGEIIDLPSPTSNTLYIWFEVDDMHLSSEPICWWDNVMVDGITPTSAPTMPTSSPTRSPTIIPTASPTANPSGYPSRNPTRAPSTNPTLFPTKSPTNPTPSAMTTLAPVRSPTIIAPYRSPDPTVSPITGTTNPEEDDNEKEQQQTPFEETFNLNEWMFAAIVAVVLCVIVIVALCAFSYGKKQGRANDEQTMIQGNATRDGYNGDKRETDEDNNCKKDAHQTELVAHIQMLKETGDEPHTITPNYDDIHGDEGVKEGMQGEDDSDDFDEMFVKGEVSESSVSKSNKSHQNDNASQEQTTQGVEADAPSFHGTKGDYYDEFHHQKYKIRQ